MHESLPTIAMLFLTGFACVLSVIPFWSRLTHWNEHVVFMLCLFQSVMYLYVAPTVQSASFNTNEYWLRELYVDMQLRCLFLYLIPFIGTYCLLAKHRVDWHQSTVDRLKLSEGKTFVLSVFSIVAGIAYIVVLTRSGLLFRRIGHEGLAEAFQNLPLFEFLTVRIVDRLGAPMICLLLICRFASAKGRRWLVTAALVSVLSGNLLVHGLNSRLLAVHTIILSVITWWYWSGNGGTITRRTRNVLIVSVLACLYSVRLTEQVRDRWAGDISSVLRVDVFLLQGEQSHSEETEAFTRANGLDLMARITPEARQHGFSWGRAWWPGLVASLGPVFAPQLAREIKAEMATTAKYYLMYDYAGMSLPDYFSCILTDAYGNLGDLGLVVCGVFYGFIVTNVTRWFVKPRSGGELIRGLVGLSIVTWFENEFLGLVLIVWLQNLPSFLLLRVLNPIWVRVRTPAMPESAEGRRLRMASNPRNSPALAVATSRRVA